MSNKHWYFEDVNLFDIMCPKKLKAHDEEEKDSKVFAKGETVYFTHDKSNKLYLIVSGKVRLLNYTEEGEEAVKAILGRGEMFGELALLGEEERNEVAEAMEDNTRICPVNAADVHSLMQDDKEFSFKIHKWIGYRMQKMERRIDNLVFKDVRSRLKDFIRELSDEKGQQKGDAIEIKHFFTHKNIAHLIGTSRQTVTTTLNELREEGILDFDRKHFYILKPQAL